MRVEALDVVEVEQVRVQDDLRAVVEEHAVGAVRLLVRFHLSEPCPASGGRPSTR